MEVLMEVLLDVIIRVGGWGQGVLQPLGLGKYSFHSGKFFNKTLRFGMVY